MIITAFTGVAIDLDKSVLLGVILSIVLFVPRAAKLKAKELIVTPERVVRERIPGDAADPSIVIYDLEGELFFGAAPELDRYLSELSKRIADDDIKFLVLRLKRVRNPMLSASNVSSTSCAKRPNAASPYCLPGCAPTRCMC